MAGILFIIEACTRPMLNMSAKRFSTQTFNRPYTIPLITRHSPRSHMKSERIIPIETTRSSHPHTRV